MILSNIMKHADPWAITAGIVLIVFGLALFIAALFTSWVTFVFGVVSLLLGIVILATLKQQEHVEPIKENE